ncbi:MULTISPECIES: hypothetical protein [unclassified Knoellia]|uniref:golvesin C-terminal-like domain-containing protein n=1 Tax=Knoellia altitudinis TaxID=3404795 RepID=UPI00361924A4
MRLTMRSRLVVAATAAALVTSTFGAASVPASASPDPRERTAPAGSTVAGRPQQVPNDGQVAVPSDDRNKVLGSGHRTSGDTAWTTSGDGKGFHVLAADAKDGYAWRTLATLAEPGVEADAWIGNACMTGDARSIVVTYAPRVATNKAELFDRGGFVAVVRLSDGAVTKLPVTSSLAYFSPSCGTGSTALVTQFREDAKDGAGSTGGQTRVLKIDARTGKVAAPVQVPGELTSAVPVGNAIVAADANALVSVDAKGTRRIVAVGRSGPFQLTPDADGGVVFLDRQDATATYHRVSAAGLAGKRVVPAVLASGPLDKVGITRTPSGRVFLTGEVTPEVALPSGISKLEGSTSRTTVSSTGALNIDSVQASGKSPRGSGDDPTQLQRPVQIRTTVRVTGARPTFVVTPSSRTTIAAEKPHPALRVRAADDTSGARIMAAGSPTDPVEAERYCSVARNDVRNQAMQPKPRQVEWAVNQAVSGTLTTSRPANWKNLGMAAYTPQGIFPPRTLSGGGAVPSQVFLAIIAQESNMWMAPGSVIPGVTGNPLIGNYYGLQIYDSSSANDWDIDFTDADCGYGVTQITDGMRLAGRTKPGETALPYNTQRAAGLDFAANVAGGLRILQDKWNQTRAAGLTINNGDVSKIENWFYAVWAYNSGFYPQSTASANGGAWGVGWLNNPANPKYPANRQPFLEYTYEDARNPQQWPYPEKVMGWAGHPVEILESPGTLVAGYRSAWWNGDETSGPANRAAVKPPVTQFCTSANNCVPGAKYTPNAPEVLGEPAGPCAHKNSAGQYDLKCWAHSASTWKSDCSYSCGNALLRFSPGYAYQEDGTAYPPNCGLTGLPSGALVIDDQADSVPIVRPGCARPHTNQGTFSLNFAADANGEYPSKTDLQQLGAGFSGHFWYAHTRTPNLRGGSMNVTGTWTLNRSLTQWARVFVHMPDHGAHTQQARYEVDLGNGTRTRVLLQRTMANKWVSLGSFPFSGTPKVRLVSNTYDGDDGVKPIENEDIAFDAVAFQPLSAKPSNIVVSMGDSYSSGEGGSSVDGANYYTDSDNNGSDPQSQNACHRSTQTWSRRATIAGTSGTIGALSDARSSQVEHHLIACSGAQSEQLLPYHTAGATKPTNAWGQTGRGQYGELSQLDKGFLDADTTLVTFSIGGNDSRFADVIAECIFLAGLKLCQDAQLPDSTVPAGEEIPALIKGKVEDSLVTVLAEVRKKAPNAKVLLMGYPKLFEGDGQCVVGVGTGEAPWLNSMGDLLLVHMQEAVDRANAAAGKTFVRFSNPSVPFAGKAVCGNPETVHGIVAPWNKTPGESSGASPSQQSFHPKIDGHGHYATSMNTTLRLLGL